MVWLTIYSNTAVYGEKWVWYFWSLAYFRFFEALNGAFEDNFFQGFIFTPYQRHWQHRDMQLRFFKVKTLLNNAFKIKSNQIKLNPDGANNKYILPLNKCLCYCVNSQESVEFLVDKRKEVSCLAEVLQRFYSSCYLEFKMIKEFLKKISAYVSIRIIYHYR